MPRALLRLGTLFLLPLCAAEGLAQFRVDIDEGAGFGIPVIVLAQSSQAHTLATVVEADLERSGFFQILDSNRAPPTALHEQGLAWGAWEGHAAEYVVLLTLKPPQQGQLELELRLFDLLGEEVILARRMLAEERRARRLAHQAADALHKKITGISGAFDTRIAYVSVTRSRSSGTRYRMYVADSDGHQPAAVLISPAPLLSPVWSPDGTQLAYVSFEGGRPQIFLHGLRDAHRRAIPGDGRSSSAPAFSPDGRQLAMAMSVDGDTEIYFYTLATGALRRFTFSAGIDTEPAWDADGQGLVFTSDRNGKPQLHHQSLRGGAARSLSIAGDYASDASVSADGRYIAFVQSTKAGGYGIVLFEPESESLFPLSSGTLDESPSFAPNGFSLIYASTLENGRKVLMHASHNGKIRKRLELGHRDVREPAWSPYRR